jgi:hypothetical protein
LEVLLQLGEPDIAIFSNLFFEALDLSTKNISPSL